MFTHGQLPAALAASVETPVIVDILVIEPGEYLCRRRMGSIAELRRQPSRSPMRLDVVNLTSEYPTSLFSLTCGIELTHCDLDS